MCGIRIRYAQENLTVTAGNGGQSTQTIMIPVAAGTHSLVVIEGKAASGVTTQSLSICVDGVATTMPFGTGNVYTMPSDTVLLPRAPGTSIDEYEFWPRDLSLDPEMLCENGTDGEWDPGRQRLPPDREPAVDLSGRGRGLKRRQGAPGRMRSRGRARSAWGGRARRRGAA